DRQDDHRMRKPDADVFSHVSGSPLRVRSSPPCGEGLGVGVVARSQGRSPTTDPPPQPSPTRGEGGGGTPASNHAPAAAHALPSLNHSGCVQNQTSLYFRKPSWSQPCTCLR